MLKLRQLQQQQQQKLQQQNGVTATTETDNNAAPNNTSNTSNGGTQQRQNSKELIRKQRSRENVFTLRKQQQEGGSLGGKRANAAELRAQKDVAEMDVPHGCKVEFKDSNDIMNFNLAITPTDGLYERATFNFTITIPNTYPYDPPKVHCDTLVYHPNIDLEGHVCLNILRQDWMPVLSLGSVIFGLMTLFLEPNPEDPLNKEAANLMIDNRKAFIQNVNSSLRGGYVAGKTFPKLLSH